tara:strand:- start:167 stop:3154 length:2988 start_codon:yes stop_codon:yes gene_type:complete
MKKTPIFGRFVLVAILAGWTFSEWYPPGGKNLIDAFDETAAEAGKEGEKELILTSVRDFKSKVNKDDQLRLKGQNSWMEAIGEADLRELFPGKTNGLLKQLDLNEEIWQQEWQSLNLDIRTDINQAILNRIQKEHEGEVKLGLDLKGGTQFVVQLDPKMGEDGELQPVNSDQLTKAMEIMRTRLDKFGVAEPLIQTAGDDKIIIQVPALRQGDRDDARERISRVAKLEFRLTHRDSDALIRSGEDFVPGATLMSYTQKRKVDGREQATTISHYVLNEVALSGSHIKRASARPNELTNAPEIHFTLDALGANKFAKITEAHVAGGSDPRLLCIVLDEKLISAPSINSRIHARGQITGDFEPDEAKSLASSLENPLENKVKIVEERDVAASLGSDSVAKGYKAAIWGLVAVAVFMLIYYLLSGILANFALALNICMILGILCWFDATLTLPGIAGVVLTIGMAVDANVLIFERIREELNAGKSLKGAIASGYDKAFGTIFDANITTVIASVILIYMGKGPVQGFGVTLTIGILTSMFTALVATRLVFDALLNIGLIGTDGSKRLVHLRSNVGLPTLDFLKYAKPAFVMSWVLIIGGFGYGVFKGKDSMLGVDFEGGFSMVVKLVDQTKAASLSRDIKSGEMRKKLSETTQIDEAQIQPQLQADMDTKEQTLRVDFPDFEPDKAPDNSKPKDAAKQMEKALINSYGGLLPVNCSLEISFNQDKIASITEYMKSGSMQKQATENLEIETDALKFSLEPAEGSPKVLVASFPLGSEKNRPELVLNALSTAYPDFSLKINNTTNELLREKLDKVGPSVSGEIQKSAVIAVLLALFGILVYVAFRYEYSFAVAAVIAVLHDVAMTGGIFFFSGRELNAPIVAAALTIIGFSINDTIVIFDRIRENLRMGSRGSFSDVMNKSLNQTLARTVITSGTTLLSTGTLYFFGGTVINDFAFTFLVGVIVGTYSSIYIACAIVLWWHKGKRPELAAPVVDEDPVPTMT